MTGAITVLPELRYRWIIEQVHTTGAVTVRQVAQRFHVSDSTAIRDCDHAATRIGHRVRGGIIRDRL
ncbi:DeoR family transcriptional regulator [Dactylosporangium sp. NPDC005555]|uniref:DeoR family transcriptional regulator n=1 Tax=Dactylosporangium sp. NPDC005555 TaxID=3154889 RepID=UPI0033A35BD6